MKFPLIKSLVGTTALSLMLAAAAARAADVRLPKFERHVLDNGTVLLLAEKRDVPIVALDIVLRGGSLADPTGREGTAALLAELLQKGAGKRDAAQFAEAVDAVGGRLSIDAERTGLNLSAEFLAEDAGLMVELVTDALRRPHLVEAEFVKLRERAIKALIAAKDGSPDRLIGLYGAAFLYGAHPYGRPSGGSEATLAAISHADVGAFHRDQFGGDRLIISAVGDFKPAAMKQLLSAAFADWPQAKAALPTIEAPARVEGRRVLLVDKPGATQTYFWLGNIGTTVVDPQRIAQNLVNTLFGGRFTSMLNSELRVRTGLTYGAGSSITRLPRPGPLAISSFTRTDATVDALDLTLATLERLHSEAFDAAQIESGRSYMLGQFPPKLETSPQLADQLSRLELFGLGRDEVDGFAATLRSLDAAAVRDAVRLYPRATDLAIVLIGDAAKIREQVTKYGPVTEMPLSAPTFRPMESR